MDDYTKTLVSNALNFIRTRQDLIDFVIDENNSLKDTGFMGAKDSRINEIGNALINDGHSGSSLACTLRICQEILRKEKNENETSNDPPPIPSVSIKVDESENTVKPSTENINESFMNKFVTWVKSNTYSKMDDNNKKAMDVMNSEGQNAAIKHMFTRDDGSTRTYAEMRALYG